MQAKKQRDIRSGLQYEHLFPKANDDTHTVLKDAGVNDTVDFIPKVVAKTLNQTKGIANALRTLDDYGTCRNVWNFVYNHIAYKKDKDGYEQIRSPARSWHDRRTGVDCDCYTTFISSVLTNLGIKHKLRITKYSRDYFQHIYPIALLPGREVVLDCVTDKFDYEVPFSEKKDYSMDLQYLNGLEGIGAAEYVDGYDEMAELGKLFKKKAKAKAGGGGGGKKKKGGFFKKIGAGIKKVAKKVNIKKVLNVVNKLNPATILLRNGVLASMKLNIGNVAKRLRWSYITPEQAKAKGMMMDRWNKLVKARKKLEEIFYGSGGKPENLKKAILQGKGNKDKAVHGFDGFYGLDGFYRNPHFSQFHPMHPSHPINRMTRKTPLRQLLGDEIFFSENSVQGLGQLGEPISGAMIAAAASIIATIAGVIKKIGDVFGGKGKGAKDFDAASNAAAEKEIKSGGGEEGGAASAAAEAGGEGGSSEEGSPEGGGEGGEPPSDEGEGYNGSPAPKKKAPAVKKVNALVPAASGASAGGGGGGSALPASSGGGDESESPAEGGGGGKSATPMMITDGEAGGGGGGGDEPKPGFWDKNKKWIVPVGIGAAGLTVLAIAAAAMKKPTPAPIAAKRSLNGPPRKKTKNHHRKTTKTKHTKVKAKALL